MFKTKISFILSLLLSINLYASSKAFAMQMNYETVYKKAVEKAKQQNKPLMMVISTKTCPWCRKLERQTLKKAVINDTVSSKFIPLTLTRDEDIYPKQFEAKVVPTVYFIDPKNEEIFDSSLGYKNKKDFQKVLTKASQKFNEKNK